ncbi:MAG: hypothetical protein HY789_06940 [Deltaproteobacteria bacterium]|nr:hypothetical protein [Deltaproteobacteria bacterium]
MDNEIVLIQFEALARSSFDHQKLSLVISFIFGSNSLFSEKKKCGKLSRGEEIADFGLRIADFQQPCASSQGP